MRHPGSEVLLAHADGELSVDDEREIARHAAGCAVCRASLAELRGSARLFVGTLHVLDGAEPSTWSADSDDDRPAREQLPMRREVVRQELSLDEVMPLRAPLPSARGARHALRWAAGIALLTAAAASAAIIAQRSGTGGDRPVTVSPTAGEREPETVTVIATPLERVLHVALTGGGAGARLYVTVHDEAEASVAVEGGDAPRFTAVAGRVDVDLRGSAAAVHVRVPSALREVRVTLDGVLLAITRDGVPDPPHAGTAGIPVAASARPRME